MYKDVGGYVVKKNKTNKQRTLTHSRTLEESYQLVASSEEARMLDGCLNVTDSYFTQTASIQVDRRVSVHLKDQGGTHLLSAVPPESPF